MTFTSKPILVTGAAGFIGFHLCKTLLDEGFKVVGLDNLNEYYDVELKISRNNILKGYGGYSFAKTDLTNQSELGKLFTEFGFEFVVNLAAQAGVRYSLTNPFAYTESNVTGFVNLLERCKEFKIKHLLYASSSSVYGANTNMPFSVENGVDHPLSLYAATKKANELLAHAYSSSFGLPTTGLRFFTAYGPWGRPDMALFLFTEGILADKPIDVYNNGKMTRDFTYVEDVVKAVSQLLRYIPKGNPDWDSKNPKVDSSFAPYSIYNVGNNSPVNLMDYIHQLEKEIGKKAIINYMPLQTGDVPNTYADVSSLQEAISYRPSTPISKGVSEFYQWYKEYYKK